MSFLSLTFYKLKIFLSNKTLLILSAIICLLTAYITGYSYHKKTLNNIPIAIVDLDNSNYSKLLLERISQNNSLEVFVTDISNGKTMLEESRIEMLFSISKGFEESIKQLEYDNIVNFFVHIQSLNSPFIKELFASNVNRFISNHYAVLLVKQNLNKHNINFKNDITRDILQAADKNWQPPLATHTFTWAQNNTSTSPKSNPDEYLNQNIYHGAILFILILIILFGTSFVIEEKNNQIKTRLSSLRKSFVKNYISNILALFIGSLLLLFAIHFLITLVFSVHIINNLNVLIVYILYILSTIFISLNIGTVLKSASTVKSFSAPLSIISSFAGGCFFNLSYVSKQAYHLSLLTPQGLALRGFSTNFHSSIIALMVIVFVFFLLDIFIQSKAQGNSYLPVLLRSAKSIS